MRTVLTKAAKVFVALMIPATFMMSCNDDSVEPSARPPKGTAKLNPGSHK